MKSGKSPYVALTVFLCLGLSCARPHKGDDMLDIVATDDVNKGLEQNLSSGSGSNRGSGTGIGYGSGPGQPCMCNRSRSLSHSRAPLLVDHAKAFIPGIQVPGIRIPGIQVPISGVPIIEPAPTVPGPCSPQFPCPLQCCQQYAKKEDNAIINNGAIMGASEPDQRFDTVRGRSSPEDHKQLKNNGT